MGNLIQILLSIPAVLIALTVHEYAHGYAAWRLGDPTARSLGRLSLNPLRHLDPIGALCMLFFRFGWAKPVPINTRYFKKPRRDMAITAFCGPLANFLLSFLGAFLYLTFSALFSRILSPTTAQFSLLLMQYTLDFLYIFHFVNLTLGLFNCLPVPPLDGSRFLLVFLPPRAYFSVMRYERYISLGLILCLAFGLFDGWLGLGAEAISHLFFSLLTPIFS
ncbi:MAG: site-2 protease family protein [Clostridia bacterium]|nr:site-2 protease family protein [Clostridia bacterium]